MYIWGWCGYEEICSYLLFHLKVVVPVVVSIVDMVIVVSAVTVLAFFLVMVGGWGHSFQGSICGSDYSSAYWFCISSAGRGFSGDCFFSGSGCLWQCFLLWRLLWRRAPVPLMAIIPTLVLAATASRRMSFQAHRCSGRGCNTCDLPY